MLFDQSESFRPVFSVFLSRLLDAQAEELEAEALDQLVARPIANVSDGALEDAAANALMLRGLRRRIAARMLRGEMALPSWRARRNQLVALEHMNSENSLLFLIASSGVKAAEILDQDPCRNAPGCFCEVAGQDFEALEQVLETLERGAIDPTPAAHEKGEEWKEMIRSVLRVNSELGKPVFPYPPQRQSERSELD